MVREIYVVALGGILCFLGCHCKSRENARIPKKENLRVTKGDSTYSMIIFDTAGNMSSLLPYRYDILDGVAYEFYPNGNLRKKIELMAGTMHGRGYYFHESGALSKYIYFDRDAGMFHKEEYWDTLFPILASYYQIDSLGIVTKIKLFNKSGGFRKDSILTDVTKFYPE